ncbi:malto-oligosyltrehalose synthase [Tessaracoccus flavus]|uniref:Malto-oligosyltrehalose synthase n=1 Tax=Tessaracoccus flavus TaxID=1610493 RepID=A0A1Q2CEJ2_9ACTN|nr:malto-oligosyltrehalose synthase [Tessaracoccus flavus]AQP44517.1 malto-oligosyltrehalose synthase [Tessaracoccus flavus]SDY71907.1 maltooligosyl trehalose synthase [Tessaracoccus flavus]
MSVAPASTYRLQLNESFTFDDAAAQVPYLARLGVTHVFCSPILQAAPGSTHGYDVVDHGAVSRECGGEEGFRRLAAAAREHGLGIIVDVVPNHMAVPTPLWLNRALWDVLRTGSESDYAGWFDIDLTSSRAILMPVLGRRIGEELADGSIVVEERDVAGRTELVVAYHDHVFPIRPGTEALPLDELLDRQWYRLAYWKVGNEELNYRRFFDVDTLAAIRVEDQSVFDASHAVLLRLFHEGLIDGFRIDHPDGLATPRGYLQKLQRATGGCWVVVEKILEPHETLPAGSRCAGTTGYDSLLRVAGLFHDPNQLPRLNDLWERVALPEAWFGATLLKAKEEVVRTMLFAEVNRLTSIAVAICDTDVRLRDHTRRQLNHAIRALLVQMDRYRAYVEPGLPTQESERDVVVEAAERARSALEEDEQATLDLVVALACGDEAPGLAGGAETLPPVSAEPVTTELPASPPGVAELRAEFMIRFAQTCGPVMAKSKEDTAFYRWNRFVAVNEVGSEPTIVGVSPDGFHGFCEQLSSAWPSSMTTLSTHDTKRSEDVRARLAALLEHAKEWEACVGELRAATDSHRSTLVDGATEILLWQTLAACWRLPGTRAGDEPISADRLRGYLTKAMREAKLHTTWTAPDAAYEEAVQDLASFALTDERCAEALDVLTEEVAESVRATVLGQKLIQLTMPGVPDVYQGCEIVDLSLVDPDNRRPVDFAHRSDVLEAGGAADLDSEKMLVTSRALRLRRDHAEAFRGEHASYFPVPTTSGHAVAFSRGEGEALVSVTVATRLPSLLAERGGWGDHQLILPEGTFVDALTGREIAGGPVSLEEVLSDLPVALLVAR